jgi:hypothetical protein
MSRTFRMTKHGYKTDWLPGWNNYRKKYREIRDKHPACMAGYYSSEVEWKNFLAENPIYKNYFYEFGEPGPRWFRNLHTIRPRRAKERQILKKIKNEYFDYDEVCFPIEGKPHVYWT